MTHHRLTPEMIADLAFLDVANELHLLGDDYQPPQSVLESLYYKLLDRINQARFIQRKRWKKDRALLLAIAEAGRHAKHTWMGSIDATDIFPLFEAIAEYDAYLAMASGKPAAAGPLDQRHPANPARANEIQPSSSSSSSKDLKTIVQRKRRTGIEK